ncbi:MAG TPA: response regulator [Herpetosiphonaceae bacterium]|nr:response regulator [Herpetosiphonaceae bacterium]
MTKRILVVEDNPDNMYVMDRILTHRGYSVGEATSGADALRMIAETPFDLVLMDMQMPGLDGYATVQTIRELVSGKEVPIIAVTAHSMPGDRERTLDAGCTDYVSKPIQTQDLLQLIEHYLGGSHVGENSGR